MQGKNRGAGFLWTPNNLKVQSNCLDDFFVCPVCVNDITNCFMTVCGHNFCEACIRECLNRRHQCPLCNHATDNEHLIKNHQFDAIQVVYTRQKQAAKEMYINQASGAPNVASPVVSVYQQHSSKILLDFEQYLQQMQSKFEKRKRTTQAEFQLKMAEIAAKVRVSGATERLMNAQQVDMPDVLSLARSNSEQQASLMIASLSQQQSHELGIIEADQEKCVRLLVDAMDSHMSTLSVSPFLLPSLVQIQTRLSAASSSASAALSASSPYDRIFEFQARSLDTMLDLQQKVATQLMLLSLEVDRFEVVFQCASGCCQLSDATTVAELKQQCRSEDPVLKLFMTGRIHLVSERRLKCFASTFVKDTEQVTDYYKCAQCNLNWVCQNCASRCHTGHHGLSLYMKQHKPSYGCCYCNKNKQCACK